MDESGISGDFQEEAEDKGVLEKGLEGAANQIESGAEALRDKIPEIVEGAENLKKTLTEAFKQAVENMGKALENPQPAPRRPEVPTLKLPDRYDI